MITNEELRNIAQQTSYPKSKTRPKYLEKIKPWITNKEIIILKGIRRCGKTHIMYQLIENVRKKTNNVFYVNFDDFRLDQHLNSNLLEQLLTLRNPNERTYYFLDEIQHIPRYEKWLRTYYDQEINVKFIIGGSNISLLSPQAATVLTGRNITFEIFPLTYNEFKTFSKEPLTTYLKYGGFPEVVLQTNEQKKKELLSQYANDIIAKDILNRYPIENTRQLKALVQFFLTNPGVRITALRLARQLGIHKDTAQKYLTFIMDTFLIFEVPYFSYSAKTKYVASHAPKYYIIDNGFVTISALKENTGALYENCIAIHLHEHKKDITYWTDKKEIDFIYEKTALQVTAENTIAPRELQAFDEFEKKHKNYRRQLITPNKKEKSEATEIIPLKEFIEDDKTP